MLRLMPTPYADTTCPFMNTPPEDCIIDRFDTIALLAPISGHGAALSPPICPLATGLAQGAGSVSPRLSLHP